MMNPDGGFERRVRNALDASPSRIPVILGGCGTGRTTLLQQLHTRGGREPVHYIDVERCATTPERFLRAVAASSPFPMPASDGVPSTPRAAFDVCLSFLRTARAPGDAPATFLLDEVLELRTFESFPGLRHVMRDLLETLQDTPNRVAVTTRYVARAHRWLRDASARFELMPMPSMAPGDVSGALAPAFNGYEQMASVDRDELGHAAWALTGGNPAYVKAMAEALGQMGRGADPLSALTALLSPEGALTRRCHSYYELRLHRARGYGALKAILEILAEQEPLTLTQISHCLHRTPGSTKDYLSWLEDVDLITVRQKRYTFSDPLLRVWVRLYCRPLPPSSDDVVREVQAYALTRLPQAEPAGALAYATVDPTPEERKNWGIIEID
jgi:hypothetical protein